MLTPRNSQQGFPQAGYSTESGKQSLKAGWDRIQQEACKTDEDVVPSYLRNIKEEKLALFGPNDEYIAVAHENNIIVLGFDSLGQSQRASRPLVQILTKIPITHLIATGTLHPLEIIAADQRGNVWSYDFTARQSRRAFTLIAKQPVIKLLAEGIEDIIYRLIKTRKKIIIQTLSPNHQGYRLYKLDRRTNQLRCCGDLNLDKSLTALNPTNNELLVGFEKGELRLVQLDSISSSAPPAVQSLDIPRVSAATLISDRYLLVAQKGGYITKVDVVRATAVPISNQSDAIARACKLLCEILRRCGCLEPCDCKTPGGQTPDDSDPGRPGSPIPDDEPCDSRHSVKLQWTPKRLASVGTYLIAFSSGNQRMAVMDENLNILFERSLSRANIAVSVGQAKTQKLVIYQPRYERLEAWSIADYVSTLPERLPDDFTFIPPAPPSTITYYGSRHHRATPNPHLNVCVFTVIEPGQSFTDPNQNKWMAQIESNIFDIVNDYYDESSYGELDVQFSVFGADFGGTRIPLVLPQPIADYFYDDFSPGGVQAVMPADWVDPVVLDGTETLSLRSNPRVGSSKNYQVPFAALWISQTYNSYPVTINFDGTETLQLTVEAQDGASRILNLSFSPLSLTLNQNDNENAFLTALATHVTNAIRSAEAPLPGSPVTIQNVVFRRIRTSDNDTEFGRLQGQFKVALVAPGNFSQKGTISVTLPMPLPAGLDALGFASGDQRSGVLTSESTTQNYFVECLAAAQIDANEGFGLNEPHFNTLVTTVEDVGAQELTVTIRLTDAKGGVGANIEVTGQSGHEVSGWSSATSLPGSDSDANNQNTLRDSGQLANDVFTAALDHIRSQGAWNPESARAMFEAFDVMMIGFVGQPPNSVPVADRWGAGNPADFSRLRMFSREHIATDLNNPNPGDTPVSMNTDIVIGQKFNSFSPGVMAHELGHALSLPDLYSASGFRDDVLYIDDWAMMGGENEEFHHFCGWSKWALGWIVEDTDDDLNRVIEVPLPAPTGTTTTEAWLVPVEYWDNSIKADVRAVVGGTVPIGQLMKVNLGSDGGVINFLELRSPGPTYSQNLPPSPAVIATNVLDPASDRRWAVNGLYRRSVHRLNQGNELMAIGDKWDFASAVEFPLKGCTVEVADIQSIRGGSIPVFRLGVTREAAAFIDLYFQDNVPSWRSPDIWVDWAGDNPDPNVPRVYPEGTPIDQGETVRFPSTGTEKHYVVARVHNAGSVRAEDVKVRWFICDPPGAGDEGRWVEQDTQTIPEVGPDSFEIAAFNWNVTSSTNVHQCLRAEIIDWTIPSEIDPATGDTVQLASDDVRLQNNNAQKNVFNFEALAGSPFDPVEFQFQVHNDYVETETAILMPENLPWGSTLEISPAEAKIKPGTRQIFNCKLSLNESIIKPGCNNDSSFLLTAWRRAEDSDEKWGSCFYFIRPRYKTGVEIVQGYWVNAQLAIYGRWFLSTSDDVDITRDLPLFVRLRLEFRDSSGGSNVIWRTAPVNNDRSFKLDIQGDVVSEGDLVIAQAWFDRTNLLGSSVSQPTEFQRQNPVG